MLKKTIISSLLVGLMVSWTASTSVAAAAPALNEKDTTITTVSELEKKINSVDLNDEATLNAERENIIENTEPEILEEYK
ncbi:hypothetical protein PGRAN_13056 [Listeria grandensis FSL F6-0971]|uniref:Uncharacterized protein n=1 Tax=Listeria grandensis FSL F6-0971 TaxID=1265819 RepID=W7B9E5_9LIST|nr:hypothetical protein [Listeria grandensis]EUJ22557.1 hypothetical protein PGRAN_13056 [Listeria grandensis FSL F6-0971]